MEPVTIANGSLDIREPQATDSDLNAPQTRSVLETDLKLSTTAALLPAAVSGCNGALHIACVLTWKNRLQSKESRQHTECTRNYMDSHAAKTRSHAAN